MIHGANSVFMQGNLNMSRLSGDSDQSPRKETTVIEYLDTERIWLRRASTSRRHLPPQELLSNRILGRIRLILDRAKKEHAVISTVLGDVLIAHAQGKKEFRVALIWPTSRKGRLFHDYTITEQLLCRGDRRLPLIINGLVSAALEVVLTADRARIESERIFI